MLDVFVELLDKHLSQKGVITNLLLKSERSIYDEEEKNEMELYFVAEDEGWDEPLATIHLYPIPHEQLCEIEIEVQYTQTETRYLDPSILWKQAQTIVEDVSFTEKRRYITPNRLVEVIFLVDFHFVVTAPQTEEMYDMLEKQIEQTAKQLGELVRL